FGKISLAIYWPVINFLFHVRSASDPGSPIVRTASYRARTMTTEQPADASARIRRAAFRLFGHKGYSRTSIQDIADAADVQKSILYYYFRNKEELYLALLRESVEILRTILLPALTRAREQAVRAGGTASCETLLGVLAETLLSLARDNRESVRFFFAHV